MKKTLTFILILSLAVLSLCGCSSSASPSTTGNTQATAPEASSATVGNARIPTTQPEEDVHNIYLPISGKTLEIDKRYEAFIPYISDEMIRNAEQVLTAAVSDQERHSGIYLTTDQDGYLCLAVEIITSLTPPAGVNGSGCGIDHDHVFHLERISTQPIP